MSYAVLELDFYNVARTGEEYLMRTTVSQLESTPPDIYKCLVVSKGDEVTEELLYRVATYSEMFGATPLPELPPNVTLFSSVNYPGTFSNGDTIEIVSPYKWMDLYNAPTPFGCVVIDDTDPNLPIVEPSAAMQLLGFTSMPAFARRLTFTVNGASSTLQNDGLANRDYAGIAGTWLRTEAHGDTWENLADAIAKFDALPGEAQSLVDAMNEDNWSGSSTERFE